MPFKPEISFDTVSKIWCNEEEKDHFPPDLSIGEIIYHEMQRHPNQIAQISATEKTVLTRKEIFSNAVRVASYMRNLGLLQSDIVGIVARNTTHMSAVAYACFFNGIAFHSISTLHEQTTIEKLFDTTKPRLIFCDGDEYEKVKGATKKLQLQIITMRKHPPMDSIRIEDILQNPVDDNFKPARLVQGNNQTLVILCSSGTTGLPKAVTVPNSRKILNGCLMLATSDVQFSLSNLDWITGLATTITTAVFSTKRIIADKPLEPEEVLHLIEEYKVSWLLLGSAYVTLTVYSPQFERTNLDSLRYVLYAGGRCSLDAQHRFTKGLQRDILHFGYGLTEVGSIATLNWNFNEKPNSVGRLTNGFQLKILNDQHKTMGPNEVGEVCLNNGQLWAGYYGNPNESRQIQDSEQWIHSGDLGYVDEDGFLFIVDRKKDLLKFKSMHYYPNEIEAVISQMPQVSEVCVFGIWNATSGDEAVAAVVKRPNAKLEADDVVDYVKQHCPEKQKQLNGGAIIVVDLKRSANGKLNRAANKTHFMELKGLREMY